MLPTLDLLCVTDGAPGIDNLAVQNSMFNTVSNILNVPALENLLFWPRLE